MGYNVKRIPIHTLLLVSALLFLCISGCKKGLARAERLQTPASKTVVQLEKSYGTISNMLIRQAQYVYSLNVSKDILVPGHDFSYYKIAPEGFLRLENSQNNSLLFATGNTPIDEDLMRDIMLTNPLDTLWTKALKANSEVMQFFYIDHGSFVRLLPITDISRQFKPGEDLTRIELYRLAEARQKAGMNIVWSQPLWDSVFNRFIINVGAPVKVNNELIGVICCRLDVDKFVQKAAMQSHDFAAVMTTKGILVKGSPLFYNALGLADPATIAPEKRASGSLNYELSKDPDPQIRTFIEQLLRTQTGSFESEIKGVKYHIKLDSFGKMSWIVLEMKKVNP
jgi:hypothetical protein